MQDLNRKAVLTNRTFYESKTFWANVDALAKKYDTPVFANDGNVENTVRMTFTSDQLNGILRVTKGEQVMVFTYLLSMAQIAFYKFFSVQKLLLHTTPFKSSQYSNLSSTTFLPIVSSIDPTASIKDLLLKNRQDVFDTIDHQDYLLATGTNDIEQSVTALFTSDGLNSAPSPLLKVPLKIEISHKRDLDIIIRHYGADNDVWGRYLTLLLNIVSYSLDNFTSIISQIPFVSPSSLNHQLTRSNGKTHEPRFNTLIELFEQQVLQTPDAVSVVYEDQSFTYNDIDELSKRLAYRLSQVTNKGDIVAIIIDRSPWMVISILGIWKAGNTYLPIEWSQPEERKEFILSDANVKTLVTNKPVADWMVTQISSVISLPDDLPSDGTHTVGMHYDESSPAYIIYTSGSTGNPKGVVIEHSGVSHVIQWISTDLFHESAEVVFQKTPYIFDVSIAEIFSAFATGGKLIIAGEGVSGNPDEIIGHIERYQITNIHFIPGLYNEFLEFITPENAHKVSSLKSVFVAGEQLIDATIGRHFEKFTIPLYNIYGPTETSIYATFTRIGGPQQKSTIGKPLWNTQALILDHDKHIVAQGVEGDLYISGVSLARGYLNRPELTHGKFIAHPYDSARKVYYTGDRAVLDSNDDIIYNGRKDNQVKIRGHRIELEEIENVILSCAGVVNAAVLAQKNNQGNPQLVAFLTSSSSVISEVQATLARKLPSFMVPSSIILVSSLPLLSSGKIDRLSLAKLWDPNQQGQFALRVSGSLKQSEMLSIWESVLGRPIGLDENFFSSGGDSIKALQIVSKLFKAGYRIMVKDLFAHPTISSLLPNVTILKRIPEQGLVDGRIPLSPIQYWFLDSQRKSKHWFNQSLLLTLTVEHSTATIERAFKKLIAHHDALRIIFSFSDGRWMQENQLTGVISCAEYLVDENDLHKLETIADQFQQSFKLDTACLVKLCLLRGQQSDRLLIIVHHLIVDGVSWRILLEDLNTLLSDPQSQLPPKSDSFKLWCEKISAFANSNELLNEVPFWKSQGLPVRTPSLSSPCSLSQSQTLVLRLSSQYSLKLVNESNRPFNTTTEELLIAALYDSYSYVFGGTGLSFNLERHGREELFENIDITRTVGWFTSLFPVFINVKQTEDISLLIREIKEQLRKIPHQGIGYGILKYLTASELKNDLDFANEPDIIFNYLGEIEVTSREPGSAAFDVEPESLGQTESPGHLMQYGLDISGIFHNDMLTMSVTFDATRYQPETIERFWNHCEVVLKKIIDYCCTAPRRLTPSDLTAPFITNRELDNLLQRYPVLDVYPLTVTQEGIAYHCQRDRTLYFMQSGFRVKGSLDMEAMKNAFASLIQRQEIFRTIFLVGVTSKPVQVVLSSSLTDFSMTDLRTLSSKEKIRTIDSYRNEDQQRNFDLASGPLVRIKLFRIENLEYEMMLSYHHIIADGWCMGLIAKELFSLYFGNEKQSNNQVRFRTFMQWLSRQKKSDMDEYWRSYLGGEWENRGVSVLKRRTLTASSSSQNFYFSLPEELSKKLRSIGASCNATLNSVIQAIWTILLSKYNDSEEIYYGTVVSGRPAELQGSDQMLGLFIHTVPVRVRCSNSMTLSELVRSIQRQSVESERNCYSSIVEATGSVATAFDHLFVFENYPVEKDIEGIIWEAGDAKENHLRLSDFQYIDSNHYDFNLIVTEEKDIHFRVGYNTSHFEESTLQRLSNHLLQIASQLTANPDSTIGQVTLGTRIVDEAIQDMEFKSKDTLISLFETQVSETPDAIAVAFEEVKLTYSQLDREATNLASYLLKTFDISPDTIIGLCTLRNENMIIGMLGILKACAAYVPLDPEGPSVRNGFIINDVGLNIIITEAALLNRFDKYEGGLVALDIQRPFEDNELIGFQKCTPEHLAYVIYTSGSTGNPKGVLVEHRSIVNTMLAQVKLFGITKADNVIQLAPVTFDASVSEIWMALLAGAKLTLINKMLLNDKNLFLNYCIAQGISVSTFTPAFLNQFQSGDWSFLRVLISAGEAANVADCLNYTSGTRVFNAYGPTECAICLTCFEVNEEIVSKYGQVPIGIPLQNTHALLIDSQGELVSTGIEGELVVAGVGVSRGYVNSPELTFKQFKTYQGIRYYYTGDICFATEDGHLIYTGRRDSLVKIRGNRVELAEVEDAFQRISGIRQAIVKALRDEQGFHFLVAYYVASNPLDADYLRNELVTLLPGYAIPGHLIELDEFPLTEHGKIDKNKLPHPTSVATKKFVAPKTKMEKSLATIWERVLQSGTVGLTDDFFSKGGHSLKVTSLISEIAIHLKKRVDFNDVFNYPILSDLAYKLLSCPDTDLNSILPLPNQPLYQASASQSAFWLASQSPVENRSYTLGEVHQIEGNVNVSAFVSAFAGMIERHEILRTVFPVQAGVPMQKVLPSENIHPIVYLDFSKNINADQLAKKSCDDFLEVPFDLEHGPLIGGVLCRIGTKSFLFCLKTHHILMDGWSYNVLQNEFFVIYTSLAAAKTSALPPMEFHFKDYVSWWAEQHANTQEEDLRFWQNALSGLGETVTLPADFERPASKSNKGHRVSFFLSAEEMVVLKQFCLEEKQTLNIFLLSALKAFIFLQTQKKDITIGSPISLRDHPDLDSLLGNFLNTVVYRSRLSMENSFRQILQIVKANAIEVYDHKSWPFTLIVEASKVKVAKNRNPLFDIGFTYHSENDIQLEAKNADWSSTELTITSHHLPAYVKSDIWVHVGEHNGGTEFDLIFNEGLYTKATAQSYCNQFNDFIRLLNSKSALPLRDIAMMLAHDKKAWEDVKALERKSKQQSRLQDIIKIKS